MEEEIIKNLEKIGISAKETAVYFTILKAGQINMAQIARSSGVKRSSAYYCLENLTEKGLVSETIKNNKKYYFVNNPKTSFLNLIEKNRKTINSIIPGLNAMLSDSGLIMPEIHIFKNIENIKTIFEEILDAKEKLARYYLTNFNLEDLFGEKFVADFVQKRVKAGIKSRALRSFQYKPEREKNISHPDEKRQVRFLDDKISIKPYICIFDDKVAVIATKNEKIGFIIKSQEYAEAQKIIFDLLWDSVAI